MDMEELVDIFSLSPTESDISVARLRRLALGMCVRMLHAHDEFKSLNKELSSSPVALLHAQLSSSAVLRLFDKQYLFNMVLRYCLSLCKAFRLSSS